MLDYLFYWGEVHHKDDVNKTKQKRDKVQETKIKTETHLINVTWQRCLLLRNAMTNLDKVLKSRDIILQANVHIGKAMVLKLRYNYWTGIYMDLKCIF